jgi:putative Mn2+ efflux pump MntP
MWLAVALAFGLAMDSTAVSARRGIGAPRYELVALPLLFAVVQTATAGFGWVLGAWLGPVLGRFHPWVAFGVLLLIGVKVVLETLGDDPAAGAAPAVGFGALVRLALATSVDAAAAGLALPLVPVEPWLALTLIGGVTAVGSAVAFVAGGALADRLGKKLEVAGGAVLIGIGVEILVSGLGS